MRYVVLLAPTRHVAALYDQRSGMPVPDAPVGGVLLMRDSESKPAFFVSENEAQEAINRTEVWRADHGYLCGGDEILDEEQWALLEERRLRPRQFKRRKKTPTEKGDKS